MIPDLKNHKHIHFIGIGGVGMGPIAGILSQQGYRISGSDPSENNMVQYLRSLGAEIYATHQAENITGADIVVTSTIISDSNPEVIAAKAASIPIVPRAQMLAALMTGKNSIAITGTHGKTTTTAMMACLMMEGGLDPTYVIGGVLQKAGVNGGIGSSNWLVAEADESDASFLYLHPKIAIVTNIDADHMDTYGGDFECLCDTFVKFLHQLPEDGLAVLCLDDPIIKKLIPRIQRPILTYGFDAAADIRLMNYYTEGFQGKFTLVCSRDGHTLPLVLNMPGEHNALNAASTYAVASTLGVSDEAIQRALSQFSGVGRRMQIYGELETKQGKALLIDDYGHHPREISVTWKAIQQAWPGRRLVVAYQPHRYTRTRDLFNDFVDVLVNPEVQLILLDVYSAGEAPIEGFDGNALFGAIRDRSKATPIFVENMETLPSVLREVLKEGDILLTQGAGSVGRVAPQLCAEGL